MKNISQILGATLIIAGITLSATAIGRAADHCAAPTPAIQAAETVEAKWGIEVTGLRMSAAGSIVDFRYKVLDSEKAAKLADPEAKPYLVDQATGAKLLVPKTPKVGALRQTAQKPAVGKVYFTLFGNGSKVVKSGSKVALVFGDCRLENLTVQ